MNMTENSQTRDKTFYKEQIFKDLPQTKDFISYVKELYKDNLIAIVATGSRTTGEQTLESDLDLDILVKDGVQDDIVKLKDLEARLQNFPKLASWVKSEREYIDPENFLTTNTPFDKFKLDGFSGLCNHVLWADIKQNGIVLAGQEDIIDKMPVCDRIPKYEGFELFLTATKEFARGNIAKALLRAAYAGQVAIEGKPIKCYKDLLKSDIFPEKLKKLLEEAHKSRYSKEKLDSDKVWPAMKMIESKVNYVFANEVAKLSKNEISQINKRLNFYQLRTVPEFVKGLLEQDYDARILDMFAKEFMAAYGAESQINLFVDHKFELNKETKDKIKPLCEKIIKYYDAVISLLKEDPRNFFVIAHEISGYDFDPLGKELFSKSFELGKTMRNKGSVNNVQIAELDKLITKATAQSEMKFDYSWRNDVNNLMMQCANELKLALTLNDKDLTMSASERYLNALTHLNILDFARRKIPLLLITDRKERALEIADHLIQDARKDGLKGYEYDILSTKAEILRESGRFEEAIEIYNKLLVSFNSNDFVARLNKGKSLFAINRKIDALEEFLEAKNLLANSQENIWKASVTNDMGNVLMSLKRYPEAKKAFDEATGLNPSHPGYKINLGRVYIKTGDNEKALENLEQALELGKRKYDVIMDVVHVCVNLVEPKGRALNYAFVKKAANYLVEALQLNATEDVYSNLLMLLGRIRAKESADKVYEQAEKLFPDKQNILLARAYCLGWLHEHEQSVDKLNRCLELEKDEVKKKILIEGINKMTKVVRYDTGIGRFYVDESALKTLYGVHYVEWKSKPIGKRLSETSFSTQENH
jgi:tetratricopeptide (TPR) repeat protein/predicted nucleotidyltransferase